MNIVLEILNGSLEGKRFWVREGVKLTVGSSLQADCRPADDDRLHPIHFSVEHIDESCQLHSATEQVPAYVNHAPAYHRVLQNGDLINAGSTRFRIRIETSYRSAQTTQYIAPQVPASARRSASLPVDSSYSQQKFPNQTCCFQPVDEQIDLLQILGQLEGLFDFHMIVNTQAIGWSAGQRFPELVRGRALLPHVRMLRWKRSLAALLEQLWGSNCACMVASSCTADELHAALKRAAVSYSRPNLFSAHARQMPTPAAAQLLAATEAVLVENDIGKWVLHSLGIASDRWRDLGFKNPPLPADASAQIAT